MIVSCDTKSYATYTIAWSKSIYFFKTFQLQQFREETIRSNHRHSTVKCFITSPNTFALEGSLALRLCTEIARELEMKLRNNFKAECWAIAGTGCEKSQAAILMMQADGQEWPSSRRGGEGLRLSARWLHHQDLLIPALHGSRSPRHKTSRVFCWGSLYNGRTPTSVLIHLNCDQCDVSWRKIEQGLCFLWVSLLLVPRQWKNDVSTVTFIWFVISISYSNTRQLSSPQLSRVRQCIVEQRSPRTNLSDPGALVLQDSWNMEFQYKLWGKKMWHSMLQASISHVETLGAMNRNTHQRLGAAWNSRGCVVHKWLDSKECVCHQDHIKVNCPCRLL